MRYQFVGVPVPYKGKSIWEIVGNLKNFGVGRLIVEDEHRNKFTEPSFYKIVRVQPMDTPTQIGENRSVLLWAEYVMRGKKLKELEQLQPISKLTKFHLIPKDEEEKYLNGITTSYNVTVIPKFQTWPPLYKKIWEQRMEKKTGKYIPIPSLQTIIDTGEKSFEVLSSDDIHEPPAHSDLYKVEAPVEELLKKVAITRLKLGILDEPEES